MGIRAALDEAILAYIRQYHDQLAEWVIEWFEHTHTAHDDDDCSLDVWHTVTVRYAVHTEKFPQYFTYRGSLSDFIDDMEH